MSSRDGGFSRIEGPAVVRERGECIADAVPARGCAGSLRRLLFSAPGGENPPRESTSAEEHRPLLTLFCVPKPFAGHIGVIQRNALESWVRLDPTPQILVCGDEPGAAEVTAELGLCRVTELSRNQRGTPLVSDVFARGAELAEHDVLAYVNADILLMSDFSAAVARLVPRSSAFLMVGRRWDLDLREPVKFTPGWEDSMRRRVRERARLHGPTGIDYFVFPRGLWPVIPPFAIGRTTWDNWLLYDARRQGAALIDATLVITPVHQNHEYTQFAGGASELWNGEEAMENLALAGGYARCMSIRDANWRMTATSIVPAVGSMPIRLYDLARRLYFRAGGSAGTRPPPR